MTLGLLPEGVADATVAAMFPVQERWVGDPVGWAWERLGVRLTRQQRAICESVVEHRYTAVQSCHAIGKSHSAGGVIIPWWVDTHAQGDAKVVSTAPSQPQVEMILWAEVRKAHEKGELAGRITHSQIPMWKVGDAIVGFGRKPQGLANVDQARAAFQGIHAPFVLVVLDEACGIPAWLWEAVDSLVTNDECRVLAIGNPDDPASHFEKVCRPGSGWNVLKMSAWDSPNFTDEEIDPRVARQLISRVWVEERRRRWGEGSALWASKVEGEFPDTADDTLLPANLVWAATRLELPGMEKGNFGVDIARYGDDRTSCYRNRGGVIREQWTTAKQDTMKTTGRIAEQMDELHNIVPVVVDEVGVGAGVVDRLREQGYMVVPFNSSRKASRPDRFINLRAEAYYGFREALIEELVDLDPSDEDLLAQLTQVKFHQRSTGQIQIESKEEMKRRGLPSPDRADAVVMSWWYGKSAGLDGFRADSHSTMVPGRGGVEGPTTVQTSLTADLLTRRM